MSNKTSQIQLDPNIVVTVVWKKQKPKEAELVINKLIELNAHNLLLAYERNVNDKSKE